MRISDTMVKYAPRGLLRTVHKITERRDGCVYRTKQIGYIVCSSDNQPFNWDKSRDTQLGSVSTEVSREIIKRF